MHKNEVIFYINLREFYNSLTSPLKKKSVPLFISIYVRKVNLMNSLKLSERNYGKTHTHWLDTFQ